MDTNQILSSSSESLSEKHYKILIDTKSSISDKYKAIFELRTIANQNAVDMLIKAFPYLEGSELLRHEIGYALGQIKNPNAVDFLISVIKDDKEFPVVRHEAAEALSYLNDEQYAALLEKYKDSSINEVIISQKSKLFTKINVFLKLRDTCLIGLNRLKDINAINSKGAAKYGGTFEPAPPFNKIAMIDELKTKYNLSNELTNDNLIDYVFKYIIDPTTHIYYRYKAIYFLRDLETDKASEALGNLLKKEYRDITGALLRHEVCFIFGQLADKAEKALPQIIEAIEDKSENEIVRHEAISAYSSISSNLELIEKYINDESNIVKESAIVCLDMIKYWSGQNVCQAYKYMNLNVKENTEVEIVMIDQEYQRNIYISLDIFRMYKKQYHKKFVKL